MKNKNLLLRDVAFILIGVLMANLFLWVSIWVSKSNKRVLPPDEDLIVVSDTIVVRDTLRIGKPIAQTETLLQVKHYPVVIHDTLTQHHIRTDTQLVKLPHTQKKYSDSLYTAWVSGFDVRLDSLKLYNRSNVIVRQEIHYKPPSKKRWGFGIQGGVGFTPKGMQPYVGIGVSYRIF